MVGHGEIAHAHPHAVAKPYGHGIDAGKHAAVPGPHVEIGHLGDLRQRRAGIDQVGIHDEDEVAVDAPKLQVARMHDEHAHHAHRHLHHFVRMRVIHERPAVLQLELVDEGLPRLDVRLGHAADPVHSIRQQHAVPMDRRVLGQLVGDEDAHLVAFDRLDRGSRRLAVVAPQVHLHARCKFAHHRLGDEVKFLPVAVHAPGQGPAVERDHGLIIGPARRKDRRLHRGGLGARRFRDACRLRAPADRGRACQHRGGTEKASARNHGYSPCSTCAGVAGGYR